jgi:HEAT repeat protein
VLDEDNATDRGMAACALGQIGSPDAIEPLVDLIGTIRWPRRDSEERSFIEAHAAVLKANAISALSRLDRDRARAVIEEELATQNPAPIDKLGLELILKDMESSPHVEGSGQ